MLESPPTAARLVALLRGLSLRHRTGVLLLPENWLGREREVAARLAVSQADLRDRVLGGLAPGQRYLGLDWISLVERELGGLIRGPSPDGGCLLVANLDLLLTSVRLDERSRFWENLYGTYRPKWGLLITLPRITRRLMTEQQRELWTNADRLAIWEEGGDRL